MADTFRVDVAHNVHLNRRDKIESFLTHLRKFTVDFAVDNSLKGFTGGKKLYQNLQERFRAQPTSVCKRKLEDDKQMEEMQLAKMEEMQEDMKNEIQQQSETARKPVGGPEGIEKLVVQNPDRKRIFIRSRL